MDPGWPSNHSATSELKNNMIDRFDKVIQALQEPPEDSNGRHD